MFRLGRIIKLLKRQGIIQEKCWPMDGCDLVSGPVDIRKLEAKVDLLLDHLDLELHKVQEHYELRERDDKGD